MYLSFYGLNEKPFDISTDPRFLWLGEKHKEALAVLKYGILDNKGFLLLTGDVGAGKTTLIHALVEGLGNEVIYATIPDPGLELMEFYTYLAKAFRLEASFSNKADFIFIFREFLYNAHDNGKRVLLIIDEAQRLSNDLLEEIRLLSNIELQNVKLLNIFFVGQVEFNTRLLEPENRAVRQRITISNHIRPLTEKEAGEYIRHRLKVAGCQKNIFSYVAIHDIHQYSGGYPRVINILCDLALVSGYVKEVKKIGKEIVAECIESLDIGSYANHDAEAAQTISDTGPSEKYAFDSGGKAMTDNTPGTVVIKQGAWPRAATLYICLLLTLALAYLMYSDSYVRFLKRWNPGIDTTEVPEPRNAVETDPHSSPKGTTTDQRNVYPLIEKDQAHAVKNDAGASSVKPAEQGKTGMTAPRTLPGDTDAHLEDFGSAFEGGKLTIDFKHNSNEFSDDGFNILEKLARFMIMNPEIMVLVIGYTDDMGTYSYNVNLSSFRANIVKSYLVGKGIDVSRIRATGLGPDNPKASNATAEGRSMNRRVEIEMINTTR